ncbi:TetR family transcriptional regulator [Pseudonocardia sp. RS11V-5]|uniref:acyl-CoA-like ligand-binding transcription factor n=1 Tax=Pseudonocardia terrae TaxID=2905831 RepID=UPI001E62D213|nr:TetR family transcriptional regulator [Pseudonocardia terrae]MCE3550870.1 TetR family transcriptional regulator [Pseudonocardia terrae]
MSTTGATDRGGRPALTSAHQLAAVAQALFVERGFEQTSVDDIAAAAGVSRRTFFRYFSTKADVLWVESPTEIATFRRLLDEAPATEPWRHAIIRTAPTALHHPPEERTWMLHRAQLLLTVPAVQEKAALRHDEWRRIATAFVARRRDTDEGDLVAIAAGHATLAATLGAHEYWIAHSDQDLPDLHGRFLDLLLPAD